MSKVVKQPLYVLGFLFSKDRSKVALIKKTKPDWQAGKLNGIGGHIEAGESPREAMAREFHEETGVTIVEALWQCKGTIVDRLNNYKVWVYCAFNDSIEDIRSTTEEEVRIFYISDILRFPICNLPDWNSLSNVPYLILIMLDGNTVEFKTTHVI